MSNKNIFNKIPVPDLKRNHFDLSHDLKFSFNMGELIPTTVIETVPGDKFKIGYENMLRFSALLAPVMHRIKVSTHYFFVPNRILYERQDGWEDFIVREETLPAAFTPQIIDPGEGFKWGVAKGSLCDYMGIPPYEPAVAPTTPWGVSALPFAAYWRIFAEYYLDQNNYPNYQQFMDNFGFIDEGLNDDRASGDPYFGHFAYACASRVGIKAWNHDYFTSALPTAQKGEDVFIPLTNMPVSGGYADNVPDPLVDQAGTIANLRRAIKLQEYLEIQNAVGQRYSEYLLGMFGVNSSDKRLNRPEYLGGSVQNMVISEVLSTAQTINSEEQVVNPVGEMSGHGISVGSRDLFNYYCEEHGWIIGIISVMPDTAYQDGIHRKFLRRSAMDYFLPKFQLIGDQAIEQIELQANPEWSYDDLHSTFGYVPRYSEYKFENSRVAGDFRDTLDFWHLARKFDMGIGAIKANLNASFIYPLREGLGEEAPFDRIFAVPSTTADTIYAFVLNVVHAYRPMVQFGLPRL